MSPGSFSPARRLWRERRRHESRRQFAREARGLLLQIPQGALPVLGSKATDSRRLRLEPYTTQTFEYFFYFPGANKPGAKPFAHYPVNVARGAERRRGESVRRSMSSRGSRSSTRRRGITSRSTAARTRCSRSSSRNNIERLNLERIAWRARKSVDVFPQAHGAAREAAHLQPMPLYRYAASCTTTRPRCASGCGIAMTSSRSAGRTSMRSWCASIPIERRAYEHLEYSPLVNQRAHRVGAEQRIANPVFRAQYQSLLGILAHKPALDAMDET